MTNLGMCACTQKESSFKVSTDFSFAESDQLYICVTRNLFRN